MHKDLRSFLDLLRREQPNDFQRITKPVRADREPVALLKRLEAERRFPVLWFERVGDSRFPVVTNLHATRERLALALGVEPGALSVTYQTRLQQPIEPVMVDGGPVHEVVARGDEVDLRQLPLITPSDNCVAPYIGGGIVVAKDPTTGIHNLSFNRLMFRGPTRLTFHAAPGLHLHKIIDRAEQHGEDLPIAAIIGYHPAFALGTLAKVPFGVDEYTCASGMLQEPVALVRCATIPLEVPANAEMILEGKVLCGVREPEGPYDEFTGYAMPQDLQTVFEITAITSRRKPIFQDIFGGSAEHLLMGAVPKEASLLARLRKEAHLDIRDVHYPMSGCGRLHAVIALGAHEPADVRPLMERVLEMDHFLKHIYIVDDDIDIRNEGEVLWAMATRFQGGRDMLVLECKQGSSLDPSAEHGGIGAKVGCDCTRKGKFPARNSVAPEILARMNPADYLPA